MIKFTCSNCGVDIEVPDNTAGRTGKCSKCGAPVVVPIPVVPPRPETGPGAPTDTGHAAPREPARGRQDEEPRKMSEPRPEACRPQDASHEAPLVSPRPPAVGFPEEATADESDVESLEEFEDISEDDFRPASLDEMLADEFSRVLDMGDDLMPEKDWSQTNVFRGVSGLVIFLGAVWIFRQRAVLTHFDALVAFADSTPEEYNAGLADLGGIVGAWKAALLAFGGLAMVLGGLAGVCMKQWSRKLMLFGLLLLLVAELAHMGIDLSNEMNRWMGAGFSVGDLLATVAMVLPLGFYLKRANQAITRAQQDEFANVIPLVQRIFEKAYSCRASDVHIEPSNEGTVVRYRIDGVLHTAVVYPRRALERIVSRVKVMAGMDIAEKRLPQDGGTTLNLGGRDIDLRVSTVPSQLGERAVIRILDQDAGLYSLQSLGMTPSLLDRMHRIVQQPHGMFFCTGPTGSGKTTTLYAALLHINRGERNVITVEDPVEYHLPGIAQLPVGKRKGMTFADGMRSILRQDPDVIMVGEVRDRETAQMATEAAQTGHLVLSTLHTNDSAGAVGRLLDLGVEPFLLASTLTAVLAQRLVRRICPECKEAYTPTPAELEAIGLPKDTKLRKAHRGRGCQHCMNTGYYGRLGIYELMLLDDTIRGFITRRADSATMRKAAMKAGMVSLRRDGLNKVNAGITTIEEVRRVTQDLKLS